MTDPLLAIDYPTPSYPFSSGYASVDDVSARVNAATWSPDDPTTKITSDKVEQWLKEATAQIDAALAKVGYWVPLRADPQCELMAGQPTYNGVGLGAWNLLRTICAAYAVAMLEATRHGAVGTANEDPNRDWWLTQFNTFLKSVADSTDNLGAFCAGGDFAPGLAPDYSKMGFVAAGGAYARRPFFHKWMNLGSGYEEGSDRDWNVSGAEPPPQLDPEDD